MSHATIVFLTGFSTVGEFAYQMAETEGRREEFTVCLQGLFIKQIIYSAEKTRVIFP